MINACKICNTYVSATPAHLKKHHNMTMKEYYDKYKHVPFAFAKPKKGESKCQ